MKSKAIYLRVSKEELDERTQLPEILKKFKLPLQDVDIYVEKFSAYSDNNVEKRLEFKKLRDGIEDQIIKEVYVYALDRIHRDMMRLMEFVTLCDNNSCILYAVHQQLPRLPMNPTPADKLTRIMLIAIYGFKAEDESYMTGQRTKKCVDKSQGVTYSSQGKKWGTQFTDIKGNNITITPSKEAELRQEIKDLMQDFRDKGYKYYYDSIIEHIARKYKISISKAFLSKLNND
jgi:DNA invertase Pin-like site-specific DNA recombinase